MQVWREIWTDINIKNVILIVLNISKILLDVLLFSSLFLRLLKILLYSFWGNVSNVGDDVVIPDDDNTDWTEIKNLNHLIINIIYIWIFILKFYDICKSHEFTFAWKVHGFFSDRKLCSWNSKQTLKYSFWLELVDV